MNDRCHYPLNTLCPNFVPWIALDDPRFGAGQSSGEVVRELAIETEELWLQNAAFCTWLGDLDIEVYSLRMFRSLPGAVYQLHVDVDPNQRLEENPWLMPTKNLDYVYDGVVKLNFMVNSHDTTMTWYRLKSGCGPTRTIDTSGNTSFGFSQKDCDEIYHTACDTACLINGGRIHTLTNTNNMGKRRLCYSLMIQNRQRTLTWDSAVELFTPWLTVD
jgi:hypothetical protein